MPRKISNMEDGATKRDGSNSGRAAGCCALEQARLLRAETRSFERGGRGGTKVAIQNDVSSPGLRLARLALGHQPPEGSRLRNQSGGKIRPGRGRRRCSIVDGAHLADVSGYRHLLGSAWDGGRADARGVDPDPHRRAGRSFDQEKMARAPVRGGSERRGRIFGPGRSPVGRDRPLSGSDQRICGPPYRDGSTRLGRSRNIPACDRDIHLPVTLLAAGRYDELAELLATRRIKFWSWHRFGAEALVRQGLWEAAIAYAEGVRSETNPGYREISIDRFCEDLLIRHGRLDEAYRRYGLHV